MKGAAREGDRDALLKRNATGVQARRYEMGARSEQKLRALRLVKEWVCGEVMPEPQQPVTEVKPSPRHLRAVA